MRLTRNSDHKIKRKNHQMHASVFGGNHMLHRIILGLLLAGWTLTAQAQQYPTKPIRVIVSIAAGSVTDVIMRAAGAELQTRLGQPLVIENNGGASGILAARQCAQAPADTCWQSIPS
jgi:tripartite-type tricarboxylate transporter receptor subunit TctC